MASLTPEDAAAALELALHNDDALSAALADSGTLTLTAQDDGSVVVTAGSESVSVSAEDIAGESPMEADEADMMEAS